MSFKDVGVRITGDASGLKAAMNTASSEVKKGTQAFTQSAGASTMASGAMDKFGKSADKTGGIMNRLGRFMADNRGAVFGGAGLISAMGEAVGMLGMYGDTAQMVAEDQERLNQLTAQGITSGHEYTQAQQELAKHQRFFNMVQRNTILSQMDQIFFSTMLISSLQQMGLGFAKIKSIGTSVVTVFRTLATTMGIASGANVLFTTTSGVIPATFTRIQGTSLLAAAGMSTFGGATATATTMMKGMAAMAGKVLLIIGPLILLLETLDTLSKTPKLSGGSAFDAFIGGDFETGLGRMLKSMSDFREQFKDEPIFGPLIVGATDFLANVLNLNPAIDKLKQGIQNTKEAAAVTGKTFHDMINTEMLNMGKLYKQSIPYINDFMASVENLNVPLETKKALLEASLAALVAEHPELETLADIIKSKVIPALEKQNQLMVVSNDSLTGFGMTAREMTSDEAITNFWLNYSKDVEGSNRVLKFASDFVTNFFSKYREEIEKGMNPQTTFNELIKNFDLATQQLLKNEFSEWMEKNNNATVKFTDNTSKAATEILDLNKSYEELIGSLSKHYDVENLNLRQAQEINTLYQQTIQEIKDKSLAIKDNIEHWNRLTAEEYDAVLADQDFIAANIKLTSVLDDTRESIIARRNAQLEGMEAAQNFFRQTVLDQLAADKYRQGIEELAAKQGLAGVSSIMLTEELEALVSRGYQPATDAAIQAQRAVSDFGDRARDSLSGLFDAENSEEFGKAWEELDLGSIPNELKDKLKGIFKEMRGGAEKGREISTALNLIAAAGTKLSSSDVDKIMKNVIKDFDDFAKIDFEASKLNKVPGLMEFIGNSANRNTPLFIAFTDAMRDQNINADEYATIMGEWAIQSGKADESNDKLQKSTKKLTKEQLAVKVAAIAATSVMNSWALAISQTAENWGLLFKYYGGIMKSTVKIAATSATSVMNSFALALAQTADNMLAVAKHWSKMCQSFVANAKKAASGVNKELAKIKDKTVTITYKTVGSPKAKGGILSFAEGGIMSAAEGRLLTTAGPRLFQIGDNPGGKESIWAIPHDNPGPTLNKILSMYSGMSKGGNTNTSSGSYGQTIVVNTTVVLSDGTIVGNFQRKYRHRQGEEVASLVGM